MSEKLDFKAMRRSDNPSTKAAGELNLVYWQEVGNQLGPMLKSLVADERTPNDYRQKFIAMLKELEENCQY